MSPCPMLPVEMHPNALRQSSASKLLPEPSSPLYKGGGSPKMMTLPSVDERRCSFIKESDLPTFEERRRCSTVSTISPASPDESVELSPSMRRLRRHSSVLSVCSVMSTKSWFEDGVAVEDVAPPDETACANICPNPVILADVKPHSKENKDDPAMAALLMQVAVLSDDCFHENCLDTCSKRGGWRITLLASHLEEGVGAILLAFIVYRLTPDKQRLGISQLAVPESQRRRGYGQRLIQWTAEYAKGLSDVSCIGLSSLAEAVKFYQRLGFKKMFEFTSKSTEQDEEYCPGQVYMELRVKKGGRAKAKASGKRKK